MNCAIYRTGTDSIIWFITGCTVKQRAVSFDVIGPASKIIGIKKLSASIKWTPDTVTPLYDGDGKQIGWDKLVSELTPGQGTEIAEETAQGVVSAHGIRGQIASMTYAQVENYVENNVTDLASAKEFLKILGKAVLATIKIQDSR
jgi:hypothetical protein